MIFAARLGIGLRLNQTEHIYLSAKLMSLQSIYAVSSNVLYAVADDRCAVDDTVTNNSSRTRKTLPRVARERSQSLAWDDRDHGGVHHTQALHSVHAELRVDDGAGIR